VGLVNAPAAQEKPGPQTGDEQSTTAASDAPEVETKAARAKPLRRHSRHRAKPSPQRDQAILDPWK
jgi:hypothetical protein